tara:strand:+ start:1306 stop:3318 length:2013 start_codon:yes stop_codon:yes gene_type:complete
MPLVNFSNVDFDQIKESIKDYLRVNSNFTDYDFEGSNLSTIIDTLAYNTYITSYNTNMVTNEVFIDSATLRENVVSLARNIGYVPRSKTASVAKVSFVVNATGLVASTLTLKAGIVAITSKKFSRKSYTFCIPSDITVPINDSGEARFIDISIYQGTFIEQTFTVSSRNPNQRFILPNVGIDTDLLNVSVFNSEQSSVSRKFSQFNSLFGVDGSSAVFFLQEAESERYELLFGDGKFGVKLQEPNFIKASYIITDGADGDNIEKFEYSGRLVDNNGKVITGGVSFITTSTPSYGGAEIESVSSIKKYAPLIYAAQNRAVTSNDYESLIPRIYAETQSVSAYGGEDLNPPAFGKVFISVKPQHGEYLSTTIKTNIKNELKKYSVTGIIPEIVDLKYLYLEADSDVYYNTNLAPSPDYVSSIVRANINSYANSTQLNKFGARFKYSKYLRIIDDSNESITSNITNISIRRDMVPTLNTFAEYEICFGNRFYVKSSGYNIRSSGFRVSGISDTVYLGDVPYGDMSRGYVMLFKLRSPSEPVIIKQNIGYVDYVKGEVRLNPINVISTSTKNGIVDVIQISATPFSNDVIGLQDLYLQLDMNNTNINMVSDRISSGNDVSGSNYIVSSSHGKTSFVRGTPVINTSEDTPVVRNTVSNRGLRSVVNTNNTTSSSY